jgi:hypothetical protein
MLALLEEDKADCGVWEKGPEGGLKIQTSRSHDLDSWRGLCTGWAARTLQGRGPGAGPHPGFPVARLCAERPRYCPGQEGGAGAGRGWRRRRSPGAAGGGGGGGGGAGSSCHRWGQAGPGECRGREGARAGTWGPPAPPLAVQAAAGARRRCRCCCHCCCCCSCARSSPSGAWPVGVPARPR